MKTADRHGIRGFIRFDTSVPLTPGYICPFVAEKLLAQQAPA